MRETQGIDRGRAQHAIERAGQGGAVAAMEMHRSLLPNKQSLRDV